MQCQVRSMAEAAGAASPPEEGVQEGRVGQVCREWLVREDGVLAYKLQHEEINQHYDGNRFRNRVVRTDLVEAKTLQEVEKEEAQLVQEAYERMLREQEEHDAEIARRLQEELLLEDSRKKQSTVEEDNRLALELYKKEKLIVERRKRERDLERERRQVEQVHATQIANGAVLKTEEQAQAACASASTISDSDTIDLTDFILEPPEGLSEQELKAFYENQDAEIARLLQEQETKRRGAYSRDRQLAIEAQDMECRVLQEQEKARLEKARLRKARDKNLLKSIRDQRKLEKEQDEDAGENRSRDGERRINEEGEHQQGSLSNVAMMLDPTYGRKNNNPSSLERPHSAGSPSQGSSSLDNSNTPSPLKSPSTQSTGSSPLLETLKQDYLEQLEDDNDPVPPYMPIQGQRRMASLEKNKKKKSRDSCKTQ